MARHIETRSFVSHTEIADALAVLPGERVTALIVGENGVGKSAILDTIKQHHAFNGHYFPGIIDAQMLDVGDHTIPVPDMAAGVSRNLPNERYGLRLNPTDNRPIVILLDELCKAPRHTQASLAPLVYEHRIGSMVLPLGSLVIATTNLTDEGLGDNMFAHTLNRLSVVYMRKPTAKEWQAWAANAGVNPIMLAFAEMYPQAWASFMDYDSAKFDNEFIFNPANADQDAYLSPRSAAKAGIVLTKMWGTQPMHVVEAVLKGTVGNAATSAIMALATLQAKLTPFEAVVADPLNAVVPSNRDQAAQCVMVFNYIARTSNRHEANAISQYVSRLPGEHQALFAYKVMDMKTKRDMFTTSNAFNNLLVKHSVAFQQ